MFRTVNLAARRAAGWLMLRDAMTPPHERCRPAPGCAGRLCCHSTCEVSRSELRVASSDRRIRRILWNGVARTCRDERRRLTRQAKAGRIDLDRHWTRLSKQRLDDQSLA